MTDAVSCRYPVFVVGMPRSGTTLLSTMLDAHPDLAISPETHFYIRCRSDQASEQDTADQVWDRLRQQPGVQDMALSEAEKNKVWELVDQAQRPSPVLRALCSTYAERAGATAWGEKTPDHLAHVPTILQEFPEAAVLCIVRDPRDVCLSLRDMPWNRSSLPESAWKWRQYAQLTDRFKQTYPDQFRAVQYETLLDHPGRVLRSLLEWLHLPYDPAVLAFHRKGGGPVDSDREPWKQKTQEPIDADNKEKWRDRMGPAEQWMIQTLTHPYLSENGYPEEEVSVNATFWADAFRMVVRAGQIISRRIIRRWRAPSRTPEDYRPEWIRRQEESGAG